ncbi:hypothetical protein KA050_03085 [Candidatus Gracilibacteria bacterium]|jgi:hypothetical protein|nr:hypothetical protein [Candidatus Gracilibacteria bacterium]
MNLNFKDGRIEIHSGAANIILKDTSVVIDDYVMDFPGEFERRGVFVEIRESGSLLFVLTIEGKTLIYLPEGTSAESLEALRDLNNKDMVIFPANETLWKTVETWEASVIAPFGAKAAEFLTKLGQTVEVGDAATIKVTDFESEVTRFVALG